MILSFSVSFCGSPDPGKGSETYPINFGNFEDDYTFRVVGYVSVTNGGYLFVHKGVNPKIGGKQTPKMDGENNGSKPYEQMDDLGAKNTPLFLEGHP